MKAQSLLSVIGITAIGVIGLTFALSPSVFAQVYSTTTITVTGIQSPDTAHLMNGLPILLYPMIVGVIFAEIPRMLGGKGDFLISLFFLGSAIGSSVGTLGGVGNVPFAVTILYWVFLIFWVYQGGQGEGALADGISYVRGRIDFAFRRKDHV